MLCHVFVLVPEPFGVSRSLPQLSTHRVCEARRLGQEWGLCDGATSAIFADLGSGVGKLVASCRNYPYHPIPILPVLAT